MKSTEVRDRLHCSIQHISIYFQATPNIIGGQKAPSPPPYPVEPSTMIVEPPAPDPFSADLVRLTKYLSSLTPQNQRSFVLIAVLYSMAIMTVLLN